MRRVICAYFVVLMSGMAKNGATVLRKWAEKTGSSYKTMGAAAAKMEYSTLRALVRYFTAFLVFSLATSMWSTDLDTLCSMLSTMSP